MNNNLSKEEIIKQAIQLHSQGNIPEATKYYQYFINQGFKDHRVFSNYGAILQGQGKYKEAELSYRKAIEIKPDYAEANSNLGNTLIDLGKFKEAEEYTRKAIEIKPAFAVAHYNLGTTLINLGKFKEAELSYRKAIEIKPDYAMAYSNLGGILQDLGKLKEAEEYTRKAIQLNPDFSNAHFNLGSILKDFGKLKEAEKSTRKAIELDPHNQTALNNYISLLTVHKPKRINSNLICVINEEFKKLNLSYKKNCIITNDEAIKIYQDGLKIYKKYNLSLEVNRSQIYKSNEVNLNCKRHKLIFNEHKIIPEFCFGCYKVQVEVDSIIELIKLFLIFNNLKLKNNNTRKVIIETRPNISGFYKGLIYCLDLNEASAISKKLNMRMQNNIKTNLISKVKRGCSEYPLEFPKYKEIRMSGKQPMNYNKNWKTIEKEVDQGNKYWGKSSKSIDGFNLNNFLIMRNWVAYAQTIRDESVNLITNEQIKRPKFLQYLNRNFISRKLQP